MKKKILSLAIIGLTLTFTGCSSEYDFVTLPEYKGLPIPTIEEVSVSDADVNARIQSNLAAHTIYDEITDRVVEKNDTVNMDIKGTINGEDYNNNNFKGYEIKIGSDSFLEGFDQAIIGRAIDSSFTISLEFPDNYFNTELAGNPVNFDVTINGIRVQVEPSLTDEFVQNISTTATTVDEYQLEIRKQLESEQSNTSATNYGDQLWNTVMAGVDVDKYPTGMLNDEVELLEQTYINMADLAGVSLDIYVTNNLGMSAESFKEQNLIMAEYNLKELATIMTIAETEGITPTQNEYVDHYQSYVLTYGCEDINELLSIVDETTLQREILNKIVKDFLVKNAVQTDVE